MYGATGVLAAPLLDGSISTHAPYVRGDAGAGTVLPSGRDFNPRPVCTGRLCDETMEIIWDAFQPTPRMYGATKESCLKTITLIFQPTPRMYGATSSACPTFAAQRYFNPRPVCTGRHVVAKNGFLRVQFQPTPRMYGATPLSCSLLSHEFIFQPTPRMYGAT